MGGIESIDKGDVAQGITTSEAQGITPASFTMKNITNAIACAVKELHGVPLRDPHYMNDDQDFALHNGKMYAYVTVRKAKEEARRASGDYWEVPKLERGYQKNTQYDESHTVGIFDALSEMAQGMTTGSRRMRQAHLTQEVLSRAEEILFNLKSTDQQPICDLDAPLISFDKR